MSYADPARQREYQRNWVARRRAEWFRDKSCLVCGATSNLELHHYDSGEKVANAIWSWSAVRRDAEIEKCEVLCHDCHMAHHRVEAHSYRRGCRCEECTLRHRERLRQYRARAA